MNVSVNSAMLPISSVDLHQFNKTQVSRNRTPEAAKELESLFVSLMLKEMRQAGTEEGLFPGDSSDTLGGMFDLYLGNFIAESGGIGLADSIEAAL